MELLISTPVRKADSSWKVVSLLLPGASGPDIGGPDGEVVFGFRSGECGLLFVLSSVYVVVALAGGMLISTVTRTQLLANQLAMVIGFCHVPPLGFTFSIPNMPKWLQAITYAIAPRYYVSMLKIFS